MAGEGDSGGRRLARWWWQLQGDITGYVFPLMGSGWCIQATRAVAEPGQRPQASPTAPLPPCSPLS